LDLVREEKQGEEKQAARDAALPDGGVGAVGRA
jgi:hypothetical protein